jgi:hypothetical protein
MTGIDFFFPGVWVHELSHAVACVLGNVPIHRVEVRPHSGMVVHEQSSVRNSLLIGFAPLIVGSFFSILLFSISKSAWEQSPILSIALFWLGFSIAFHSIPSHQDVANIPMTISLRLGQLWRGSASWPKKLAKSGVYFGLWPVAGIVSGFAFLVNLTLLTRVVWSLALAWAA